MDAPILYFATGQATPPAYALPPQGFTRRGPAEGPEGTMGTLFSAAAGVLHLEYLPERQQWVRLQRLENPQDPTSNLWMGCDRMAAFTPDAFVRENVRSGHRVKLGDGHDWEIPVARLAFGGSGLPRRRILKPDGSRAWEVDAEYAALSAFAERAYLVKAGGNAAVTMEEIDAACGQALSVNYRIGTDEAIALGLFTDEALRAIIDALLDWPTIHEIAEAQKKTSSIHDA